jgi:hypothetical protein
LAPACSQIHSHAIILHRDQVTHRDQVNK